MTPEAAVFKELSSFGMPAYASTSVPDGAEYPYLTYELVTDDFTGGMLSMAVNLWYRGDSESEPNAGARMVADRIGAGRIVECDGGGVLLMKGSPFCQSMGDPTDDKIKRRYISLQVQYLTM